MMDIHDEHESDDSLLRDARKASRRGSSEVVDTPETETLDRHISAMPQRVGRYRIKRAIASGGMGTVYEAVQEQPRRTVAVKLMRSGIASRSALRRFEYESQLLARLRHPGIAQVYDAGTHRDGEVAIPYFAMEYIPNAKPITEYADAGKLSTHQRLDLFVQVCEAVHYGHQKGIIHRDLKPSNILVESAGGVKIIDFGVARCTDSDMALTAFQTDVGQLIGTLQYMSPEQCEADPHDFDIRSDVYSLGVVLYELVSGRLPYDVSSAPIHEATRLIREQQPTRLSSVNKMLRGDVETITLKSLEKDRRNRYQSAADVASDIACYLAYRPIRARPPSLVYQLRRFVRRRRVPLTTCAVVLLAMGFAVDRQIRASVANSASRARDTAYSVFYAAQPDEELSKGKIPRVVADCTRAIGIDPSFALAYALRAKAYTMMGNEKAAWRDCNQALALEPKNAFAQRTKGYLLLKKGDEEGARRAYERGFQKFVFETDLPRSLHNRARVHANLGDYQNALRFHDGAVALSPRGRVYVGRAITRRFAGDLDGAIDDLKRAASIDPQDWGVQPNLWIWEICKLRGGEGDEQGAAKALAIAASTASAAMASTSAGSAAAHQKQFEHEIVKMIRESSDASRALALARTPAFTCCAYYYAGVQALVKGQEDDARKLFEQAIATKAHEAPESDLARWHLARLDKR